MLLFLVVFSAVMVPYRIGFEIELSGPEAVFDFMADIIFLCDITLNFRTAFKEHGVLVTSSSKVRRWPVRLGSWAAVSLRGCAVARLFGCATARQ